MDDFLSIGSVPIKSCYYYSWGVITSATVLQMMHNLLHFYGKEEDNNN